jgi:myb proto-oncogene protein
VKNYWNSYLKKRVDGSAGKEAAAGQNASETLPASSAADSDGSQSQSPGETSNTTTAREPASSGLSEPPHESSSADSSCLTAAEPPAACRANAPVAPKVMFADWLDMDYVGHMAAAAPGPDAGGDRRHQVVGQQGSSMQVDGPSSGMEEDSLQGFGWEFLEHFDGMDQMQVGGGFCDLLANEFFGIN